MKLADLKPRFVRKHDDGRCVGDAVVSLGDAVGVEFGCPSGADHRHFVPFANRGIGRGWDVAGTGLADLTTTPSILIHPNHECAGVHFFITAGEIRQ
jgi:hypothetical protein